MLALLGTVLLAACNKDPDPSTGGGGGGLGPTPYNLEMPAYFPPLPLTPDNELTEEGMELGRFLFYEERLSGDNTQSCGSCHAAPFSFTDNG
ncbi:MAG: cytochrome-c peroxidase, partial [Flavobacteriales bacterium]|nr:cytochrome-c peroxidase [Flavobacteriales bacterium]